jgi:hypothetical protein
MIYTHVLGRGGLGVPSPADTLSVDPAALRSEDPEGPVSSGQLGDNVTDGND